MSEILELKPPYTRDNRIFDNAHFFAEENSQVPSYRYQKALLHNSGKQFRSRVALAFYLWLRTLSFVVRYVQPMFSFRSNLAW